MDFPSLTQQYHRDVYDSIRADRPELSVSGKRVVITGGAGGIGSATARAFLTAGAASVFLLGRMKATLDAAASTLRNDFPKASVTPIVSDIRDPDGVTKAFDQIAIEGPIDVFIANAGAASKYASTADSDPADWWNAVEINVRGCFLTAHAALKNIAADGVVINVSSGVAHLQFVPGTSAYSTSKIATAKLFQDIQYENPGLRVFSIQPAVEQSTEMASKYNDQGFTRFPDEMQNSCRWKHIL